MNLSAEALAAFEIKVENHLAYNWQGTAAFGSCFPAGQVKAGMQFHLRDRAGQQYPLDWRPLLTAPDGSVTWAYFTFPLQLQKLEYRHYTVVPGAAPVKNALEVASEPNCLRIRNGEEEIIFEPTAPLGLGRLTRDRMTLIDGTQARARFECEGGTYIAIEPLRFSLRHQGAFEVVVAVEGELKPEDEAGNGEGVTLRLLYSIRAGQTGFHLNVLFSNRRTSDEDLLLKRLALTYGTGGGVKQAILRQNNDGDMCRSREVTVYVPFSIANGVFLDAARLPRPEPETLHPFFRKLDQEKFFGGVAPFAGLQLAEGSVVIGWQRATLLEGNSFSTDGHSFGWEPVLNESGYRVPQGFSRSFDCSVSTFSSDITQQDVAALAAVAENAPLVAVHPQWLIQNEADEMARILPYDAEAHPRFENMLWREFALPYFHGFYNTGDYTSVRGSLEHRVQADDFTWNNNEEDHLKGIAWMMMRSGDPSYMADLRLCGRHLLEVDRRAVSSSPLQHGIFIAHAKRHFDGMGYPSHCWAEGVLLYYKLTGDEDALEAFLELCECHLRWMDIRDDVKYIDAREMGTPLTNFAQAIALNGDERYRRAAWDLIGHLRQQMDEDGGLYYSSFYPHLTPYAEYVAIEGLWDFYELACANDTERQTLKTLLIDIIGWVVTERLNFMGIYDGRYTGDSFLNVFYIAYALTGDEKWLEKGRAGLIAALSQTTVHPGMKFFNNAAFYHEAKKRGWFDDTHVPLNTVVSTRASYRVYEYAEPNFSWEKQGRRLH